MGDKHAAAYHNGNDACGCGNTHTSVLQAIYCLEQMETEDRHARKEPKAKRPSNIIRSID